MARYAVRGWSRVKVEVIVEAESEDEAIDKWEQGEGNLNELTEPEMDDFDEVVKLD